ncbi:FAD-dependent oxidoreductase [Spirobacillus cienkowskii]|jgi:hypothetical protein|uniref:FAD-binding oxidoreductase n=1 Tax=Spirobacillus cienkowskii TaxID=495820 RepID=A0A369KUE5_9BACT|nr:MAG: FAD-binding oxidoreductase [Spirobacillus cienkowskii]
MSSITVVGSGIIGLSVAEFLSKNNSFKNIQIISEDHQYSGSKAAAANLATKGQLYGRDKHFQYKINSKKIYSNWIESLIKEINLKIQLEDVYKCGYGIDYFTTVENRDKHFNRVMQNTEELIKRNITELSIIKLGENKIQYKDESWVNAKLLLNILNKVLILRGVNFIKDKFDYSTINKILTHGTKNTIIFCTGAWTKSLLTNLGFQLPKKMQQKERLTFGTTFFGQNIFENFNNDFVLQEIVSENLKNKVTFSGNSNCHYLSSSSIKINDINFVDEEFLKNKNEEILNLSKVSISNSPVLKNDSIINKMQGYRVGYGHEELVVEKIYSNDQNLNIFVCAGAHKSGYLFAPVVGSILQNLQLDLVKF